MAKSAQDKFNDYLAECRETSDAVNELTNRSYDEHGNYAYAAGFLGSILQDAISELPKARRADFRNRLYKQALKFKKEVDTQAA